jgi:translocator protein
MIVRPHLPEEVDEVRTRPLALALGICLFFVLLSAFTPPPEASDITGSLALPSLEAPVWLVLLVGILYYPLFAALLYRTLAHVTGDGTRRTLALLLVSALAVNALWNGFLGNAGSPFWGMAGAGLLLALLASAFLLMLREERRSAVLLAPYLLWVVFDFTWSFQLWRLNPG